LDLSSEPPDQIIPICRKYFKRLTPMKVWLEIVIGMSAGDPDGSLVQKHEQVTIKTETNEII
jgi:fructose/tagatose bisphosphate aldolase